MIDEKLNFLIKKYGIYDVAGIDNETNAPKKGGVYRWKVLKTIVGGAHLMWELNEMLDKVNGNIALWAGKKGLPLLFMMIFPWNKEKIRLIIQDAENEYFSTYHGRSVVSADKIETLSIDCIVVAPGAPQRVRCLNLIERNFRGKIIDMDSLIIERNLTKFFDDLVKINPYTDIFIARHFRERSIDENIKQIWHRKLIGYYIQARDFLSAKMEIEAYERIGYQGADKYKNFLKELEGLLLDIKGSFQKRKQRDIFIFWLDSLDKEGYCTMKWLGNQARGKIFHRAYTTMVRTTMVARSIFTGNNVKEKRLFSLGKLKIGETVFKTYPKIKRRIKIFSTCLSSKFEDELTCDSVRYIDDFAPFMMRMWHAMDDTLKSSDTCVNLIHCLETHGPYFCGELQEISWGKVDFSRIVEPVRDYFDRQLEWYQQFIHANSISIFMADHTVEQSLREECVNVPFLILGKDIPWTDEERLFSLKNIYKLVEELLSGDGTINKCFSDYIIVDQIDPYEKNHAQNIRKEAEIRYRLIKKLFGKDFLKRYIQSTKIVTAEGEYYTINILGEETYYRDKECKINLADNPAYAERIAELREKAGKFYNPWKEKRQVAIDFYEYLGIKEKDILAQCY